MNSYAVIVTLLLYYAVAFFIKKYYYKRVNSSLDGFFRYILAQTIIVGLLIISALFVTPIFFDAEYNTTVFPFLMILINSIFETICFKKGLKKILPVMAINFYLYLLYFVLIGICFSPGGR